MSISKKGFFSLSIATLIGVVAFFFEGPADLDLSRYYETARKLDASQNVLDFIKITFKSNFDFIYYLSFLIIKKIGLSINIVNLVFVFVFYYYTFLIIDLIFQKETFRIVNLIKLYTIFTVPILIIFTISRNVAAVAFFYIAIYNFLKGKKSYWLFILLSIFTHVGMLLFVSLSVIPLFLNKFRVYKVTKVNFCILSTVFFFAGISTSVLSLSGGAFFQDSYARYGDYAEKTGFSFDTFSPAELLYYFSILLINFYFILKLIGKTREIILYLFIGVFFFQLFSINYSVMFFQRSVIFNILLSGYLFGENILRAKFTKKQKISFELHKFLVAAILIILAAYLYSYRGFF